MHRTRRPSGQPTLTSWGVLHAWLSRNPAEHQISIHTFGAKLGVRVRVNARVYEDEVVQDDEDPSRAAIRAMARLSQDIKTPVPDR